MSVMETIRRLLRISAPTEMPKKPEVTISFYADGSSCIITGGEYALTPAQHSALRSFELDQMQLAIDRFERSRKIDRLLMQAPNEIH